MRIGELSKRSGLTASRIRFYESSGLIRSVERSANGYRDYGAEAPALLEIIAGAQAAGFSLEEIRHLLPTGQDGWQHDDLLASLRRKIVEIEALQARLAQNKTQLQRVIKTLERGPEGLDCRARTTWVLDRLREDGAGKAPATRRTRTRKA